MATRSAIGYVMPRGHVRAIYCHWDGYPEHNGRILVNHYNNPAKIQRLIEMGNLSALGAEIEPRPGVVHEPDNRQRDVCLFYNRDCNEPWSDSEFIELDGDNFVTEFPVGGPEYYYLYDQDHWLVLCVHDDRGWMDLETELTQMEIDDEVD